MAKFFGCLITASCIPLHFLKLIDFSELTTDKATTKPTLVFLHLLLDQIFEESENAEVITDIFTRGLPDISNKRQLAYDSDSDDFMGTKASAKAKNKKPAAEDNSGQLKDFIRGFSNFLLTKFYNRVKDDEKVMGKMKAVFNILAKRKSKNII